MTAAERKKAKAIARKKKKTEEKSSADNDQEIANGSGNNKNRKGAKPGVVDEDPLGKELLQKDPLDEARKYAAMLTQYAPKSRESWTRQYDVAIRRKKMLMALQALFKGLSIDNNSGEMFSRIVDFSLKLGDINDVSDTVKRIVNEEAPKLLGGKNITDFVNAAADRIRLNNMTDLNYRSAVARAMVEAKVGPISEAALLITDGGIESRNVTLQSCKEALSVLKSFGAGGSSAVESWTNTVRQRFEKATSI
jgi:peptide alpha-N-acetyltransferase